MKYARCLEMSPATTSTSGVRTCDSAMSLLRTIGEVSEISTGISSNWTVSSNGGSMRLICKHFRDNRSRTLGRLSVLWSTINLKLVGNIMDPDPDANTRRWNHSLKKKSLVLNVSVKLSNRLNNDTCITHPEWWTYRYYLSSFPLCCLREVNSSTKFYFQGRATCLYRI